MEEALVFIRGQKVLKVKKLDYTRHPEARMLEVRKATEHVPGWREVRQGDRDRSDFVPWESDNHETECEQNGRNLGTLLRLGDL